MEQCYAGTPKFPPFVPNLAFRVMNVARAPAAEVRLSRRFHRNLPGRRDDSGDGRLLRRAWLSPDLRCHAGRRSGRLHRTRLLVLARSHAGSEAPGAFSEDEEALR